MHAFVGGGGGGSIKSIINSGIEPLYFRTKRYFVPYYVLQYLSKVVEVVVVCRLMVRLYGEKQYMEECTFGIN